MEAQSSLDRFGKFIVENLRDNGIDFAEGLLKRHWKAPSLLEMQNEIANLNETQKTAFMNAIIATIDGAMHDFLFALQSGFNDDIQIMVDGKNIVELSDGIHGEAYSDEGWFAKYSKYKSIE